MNNRFKFNAIVSSYYDIDTPEEYKEVEPQFYLKNVDVFCTGEIGVDYDTLLEAVKEQSKDLTAIEIGQIMQHFEDNSNSIDCEFVTITPDKIIQCTGLKDKNGKLIYEGDIAKYVNKNRSRDFNVEIKYLDNIDLIESDWLATGYFCVEPNLNLSRCDILTSETALDYEVIGNIYDKKSC